MSYLDLRDLAKEYTDLKERAEDYAELKERAEDGEDADAIDPLDEDEQERLKALTALEEQLFTDMESYAENESTMIPEEDFEDYAQQFAEDVGYFSDSDKNPLMLYIDWAAWAEAMQDDYTTVEFEDRTYLIRTY